MRQTWKYARWVVAGAVVLQFGGCFGAILSNIPVYLGLEFLLDGPLLDIFPE